MEGERKKIQTAFKKASEYLKHSSLLLALACGAMKVTSVNNVYRNIVLVSSLLSTINVQLYNALYCRHDVALIHRTGGERQKRCDIYEQGDMTA